MTDRDTLTAADRAILVTIDATLDGDDTAPPGALADFCLQLRDSAPLAADEFRQRLRAEVIAATAAERAAHPAPWWQRRLTRRQVAAGLAGLGLGGAALATAQVARMLNTRTTAPGGEGRRAWAIETGASPPLVYGTGGARWVGQQNDLFAYMIIQVQRERWQGINRYFVGRGPQPGSNIALANGRTMPIPSYLPPGFAWQGMSVMQDPFASIGSMGNAGIGAGGGGGSGLPWERLPQYDGRVSAHLLGGDLADRFLMLTQLRPQDHPNIGLTFTQIDVPGQMPQPYSVPSGAPTRMPTSLAYAAKLVDLLLVRPASGGPIVAISVGAATVQDIQVGGLPARQFTGVWGLDGRWDDTPDWCTLVWERDGYLYHLAAQQLPLVELVRVAESLPATP